MKIKFNWNQTKKLDNFQEYFDLAADKSRKNKLYEFINLINKRTKKYGYVKNMFSGAIILSIGLLILPGGKFTIQREIKKSYYKLRRNAIDLYADIIKSAKMKKKMIDEMSKGFKFDNNRKDIFDRDLFIETLNKLSITLIDYSDQDNSIVTTSLNHFGIIVSKLFLKDPEIFFEEKTQNAILNYLDIAIEQSNFEKAKAIISDEKAFIEETLFELEVGSYTSLITGLQLVLRYTQNPEYKKTSYDLLNKLMLKQDSEVIGFENAFCSIDGINILLEDLGSNDEKIQMPCLVALCSFFKNDQQAIRLLKTRILSNLLINFKDPKYRIYLKSILQSVLANPMRKTLVEQSELFKVEKQRLEDLTKGNTLDKEFSQLLKNILEIK